MLKALVVQQVPRQRGMSVLWGDADVHPRRFHDDGLVHLHDLGILNALSANTPTAEANIFRVMYTTLLLLLN